MNMTTEEREMISETIIEQLGGAGRLQAFVAANTFMSHENGELSFKFKGSRKANYIKISLNKNDLYDLEFGKIGTKKTEFPGVRMPTYKKVEEVTDIFFDMLIEVFERTTGLFLHF